MKPVSEQKSNEGQKPATFDVIAEVYDWIHTVAAALILGLIIGFAVYVSKPDKSRLGLGIAIIAIALFVGIILATNSWKKKKTIHAGNRNHNGLPQL